MDEITREFYDQDGKLALDINMPTPEQVAVQLEIDGFTVNQAGSIAAEVYQPIRGMLRSLALRHVL